MNDDWQKFLDAHDEANFLQSSLWAETNRLIGHKILVEKLEDEIFCLMIIKDAKRGRYLEIPGGPLLDWSNKKLVKKCFEKIKQVAKENKCVFVRFRPQLLDTPENRKILAEIDAKPAAMHLHAQNTIIIDLKKSEEDLLAAMRRQTRYEVRRSEKLGLKIEKSASEEIFREFHQVQLDTANHQHFIPPDLKTLLAEHEAFGENGKIYVAKTTEGEAVAYGMILFGKNEAAYFEAASTDLNHKLPGSYAILWAAIRDAKAAGCTRFNLWGIAPPNSPNHRYAGVTTFKAGFGGDVVNFVPAHDIVINKLKYSVNYLVETTRKKRRHL